MFSTWYKDGVESLARAFLEEGMELVATGNTKKLLLDAGLPVMDVSDLTGEPERFGGRVKTLHHKVLGGILFRPHKDESEWPFDYRFEAVVCNFYPFEEKVKDTKTLEEAIEWVDIGGPTMVRAAAKNFEHVYVFTSPSQYARYIACLKSERAHLRRRLAYEAFENVSNLDEEIRFHVGGYQFKDTAFELKYGENPHQRADFCPNNDVGVQCFGTLGYNNIRDAEAAFRFVRAFEFPAVSVVKHQTLCGAAAAEKVSASLSDEVFRLAWEGDLVSRFGGIIGFNFCPSPAITEILEKKFVEIIVAPRNDATLRWAEEFFAKKPRTRIVLVDSRHFGGGPLVFKEIWRGALGTLRQEADFIDLRGAAGSQFLDLFGQWAGACSKSNAIVLCGIKDGISYVAGVGQGQPNRVEALEKLALPRAKDFSQRMGLSFSGLTCVSDAFLPFSDVVKILAQAGVRRLVQPGGSKADEEVKSEAQKLDIEMVMTGVRHFWH